MGAVALSSLVALLACGADRREVTTTAPPAALVSTPNPVGSLVGAGSVTADGAAAYTIALKVAPARAGMQPSVMLAYSSQSGNGTVGVGWSVTTGASQIAPCGSTIRADGEVRPVQLVGADHLCLDGARLITATPDTPDEFRTEPDTQTRVVVVARDALGPTEWTVYRRDGRIARYGRRITADVTTIVADDVIESAPRVLAWLQTRVEDPVGNYMTYRYEISTPGAPLEWTLTAIDYGGFRADGDPDHLDPNRSVVFSYASRPDPFTGYARGVELVTTRRLASVTMNAPSPASPDPLHLDYVRRYDFSYDDGPADNPRSRLAQVTLCDALGGGGGNCLPPTKFSYSDAAPSFTELPGQDQIEFSFLRTLLTADIDFDGRDDLVYQDAGGVTVWRGTATGFVAKQVSAQPALSDPDDGNLENLESYDRSSDGRADLIATYRREFCCNAAGEHDCVGFEEPTCQEETRKLCNSNGSTFPSCSTTSAFQSLADGDGDLLPDRFKLEPGIEPDNDGWSMDSLSLSNAPAWRDGFGRCGGEASCDEVPAELGQLVDLDGDGVTELLVPWVSDDHTTVGTFGYDVLAVRGGHVEPARTNLASGWFRGIGGGPYKPWAMNCSVFADVNGDGLPDQVGVTGGLYLRLNRGNGVFNPAVGPLVGFDTELWGCMENDSDAGVRVVDYNQDGRDDILLVGKTTDDPETARVLESTGTGFVVRATPVPLPGVFHSDHRDTQTLDINGDGLFDIRELDLDGRLRVFVQTGGYADKLVKVENGFGAFAWGVTYQSLVDTGYVPPAGCVYPERCLGGAMLVVRDELEADATSSGDAPAAATAGVARRRHSYEGSRADSLGEGWLGFLVHTVTDLRTGAVTRTTFKQERKNVAGRDRYPYQGMPDEILSSVVIAGSSVTLQTRQKFDYDTRTDALGRLYFPFTHIVTVTESDDVHGVLRTTTTTTELIDEFANPTRVITTTGGETTTTMRTVVNDPDTWWLGRLDREETTSVRSDLTATRVTEYTYEPDRSIRDVVRQPEGGPTEARCEHVAARNAFQLPTRTEVRPGAACTSTEVVPRWAEVTYDDDGTFIASTTDSVGTSSQLVHPGLAVVVSITDVNQKTTTLDYDGLGRPVHTTSPDGTWTATRYDACGSYALCVTATDSAGGYQQSRTDKLGRTVRTLTLGLGGDPVYTDMAYNALGQLVTSLRPRFGDDPQVVAARYTYDEAERVTSVCQADASACETTAYDGLRTDHYDEGKVGEVGGATRKHTTTWVGPEGEVDATAIYVDRPDVAGEVEVRTTFAYGPFGTLRSTATENGDNDMLVSMAYDALGRQTDLFDADTGHREYTYTAFDQLDTTTDAKGQVTVMQYDAAGRLTERIAPDGTDAYVWDLAPGAGKGRLAKRTRGDVSTTFEYDPTMGQVTREHWAIGEDAFTYDYAYDPQGRLEEIGYPEVPGRPRFVVDYVYDDSGHLAQALDARTATPEPLWTAATANADGSLEQEVLGNGLTLRHDYVPTTGQLERVHTDGIHDVSYVYNPNGTLRSRTDHRNNHYNIELAHTEIFTYDRARRLSSASVEGRTPETYSYSYDDLGNALASNDQKSCKDYRYGGTGYGPHQLARSTCFGGIVTAQYDANGNVTGTLAPDFRSGVFTSFDKTLEVHTRYGRMRYTYDADHQRVKKERVPGGIHFPVQEPAINDDASGAWDTTVYPGTLYERREISGSAEIEHIFYVMAGGNRIAYMLWHEIPAGIGSEEWRYLHTDYQGTVERTTDAGGALAEWTSYDAWGAGRRPDWTSRGHELPPDTRLGYTGHSHDDELTNTFWTLIDMGGRSYDSFYRRFTSPDPMVQAPTYGPSWNRYSYVFNSPTNYTDPSGFRAALNRPNLLNGGITVGQPYEQGWGLLEGTFGIAKSFVALDDQGVPISAHTGFASAAAEVEAAAVWRALNAAAGGGSITFATSAVAFAELPVNVITIAEKVAAAAPAAALVMAVAASVPWMFGGAATDLGYRRRVRAWEDPRSVALQEVERLVLSRGDNPRKMPWIFVSQSRFPEAAAHILEAQVSGYGVVFTIDRENAEARRKESLRGLPIMDQLQRDEYPMAMFLENGIGHVSVAYIDPYENMASGAVIGAQCRPYRSGTRVIIAVIP